jgi:hypothetical protein
VIEEELADGVLSDEEKGLTMREVVTKRRRKIREREVKVARKRALRRLH